jgi:hypothetical protein
MRPTQSEVNLLIFIVAILTPLVIWPFYRTLMDEREAAREGALQCLKNMISITDGDQGPRVCPRSLDSYRIEKRDGRDVLSCPSPGNHLPHHPQFTRRGDEWALNLDLPDFPTQSGEPIRVHSATIDSAGGRALIQVKEEGASRFVFAPLLILLGGVVCLVSLSFPFVGAKWVKGWMVEATFVGKLILPVVGFLGTMVATAVPLAMGLGIIWIAHKDLAYSQEIVITHASKDVVIQDFYFGKPSGDPVRITNVKAFYPFDEAGRSQVIVIYQNQERLEHRSLFTVGWGQVGVVSVLHQALIGAKPSW